MCRKPLQICKKSIFLHNHSIQYPITKKNKMKKVFSGVLTVIMAASCQTSPKVVAELTEAYPSRPANSVMVYDVSDSVPAAAKTIGKVKCVDGGLTPTKNCLYGNMLALAVRKTAESGGNVLRIDKHKYPDGKSTCHRFWGTIMLMPDSLVKSDTQTSLQNIEERHDAEYAEYANAMIQRQKKLYDVPHDVVKVGVGPGWILSEFTTYNGTYKRKMGFNVSADYQHIWNYGFGLGVNYQYFGTSFDNDLKLKMHYIGPSLAASMKLGKKWIWDVQLGLGYTNYTESISNSYNSVSESISRMGVMAQMGVHYKMSDKIGIGLQLDSFRMSMERPEGIDTSKYDFYGIERMDLQFGLRFYM